MTPSAWVFITSYNVSCLPLDHPDWAHYVLVVDYRRDYDHRWVVTTGTQLFDADGNRAHYSTLNQETLLRQYTFPDPVTALDVARRCAPHLVANGRTAAQILDHHDSPGTGTTAQPGAGGQVHPGGVVPAAEIRGTEDRLLRPAEPRISLARVYPQPEETVVATVGQSRRAYPRATAAPTLLDRLDALRGEQ